MDRKEFTQRLLALGACPFILSNFNGLDSLDDTLNTDEDEKTKAVRMEKEFIEHWLEDLLNSMEKVVDRETQVKIVEGCGKGCFDRHQFKQDIATKGSGNLDKLIEAYKQNFEIWKEGDEVHIRYGKVSKQCYCPAAKNRPPKPNDLHCECTRMTHQTIFETAMNRQFKVDIAESLRRGGKTCHFVVHLS
jgi:hypothetical protein